MSDTQAIIDPKAIIILAEDDDVDAKIIAKSLAKENINNPISRAHDGEEAFALINKSNQENPNTPHILLIDINMPKMNGLELIRKIHNSNNRNNNLIFVFSGSKSDEEKLRAYDFNITGYISKDRAGKDFHRLAQILNRHWKLKDEDQQDSITPR